MNERSLVLLKPDAVQRGIVGEILHRFERAGLKIVGAKLVHIDEAFASKHYNHDEAWCLKVGERNIEECKSLDVDVLDAYGTVDPKEIGKVIDKRNAEFLAMGPVFAFVFDGPHAVSKIRSLVGSLFPHSSVPGTIRGDFGLDSGHVSLLKKRTSFNIIHASGEIHEAIEEINLWFKPEELVNYRRTHEDLYSY